MTLLVKQYHMNLKKKSCNYLHKDFVNLANKICLFDLDTAANASVALENLIITVSGLGVVLENSIKANFS